MANKDTAEKAVREIRSQLAARITRQRGPLQVDALSTE